MSPENQNTDIGKKIADALKAENDLDLTVEDLSVDSLLDDDFSSENFAQNDESKVEEQDFDVDSEENFLEETIDSKETSYTSYIEEETDQVSGYKPIFKVNQKEVSEDDDLKLSIESEDTTDEFEMPNNINVLKRLIGQLPSGVPRQTGALIIRQTIEALGISMKSVLQDAQKAKDCLNSSIKDCSFTIQEYKTNIRNLEKQSLGYQRQLAKLNDIIGLFVYSEKNSK
ncbi:hypothetical protein IKA92_05820 [bacterium]|nr:hypothetical protein [bacterium]